MTDIPALTTELLRAYPFLSPAHADHLARYDTHGNKVLGNARSMADPGQSFGLALTEREITYLVAKEWACTADDIVWRRSKLGLHLTAAEIGALDDWIPASHRVSAERLLLEAGART